MITRYWIELSDEQGRRINHHGRVTVGVYNDLFFEVRDEGGSWVAGFLEMTDAQRQALVDGELEVVASAGRTNADARPSDS